MVGGDYRVILLLFYLSVSFSLMEVWQAEYDLNNETYTIVYAIKQLDIISNVFTKPLYEIKQSSNRFYNQDSNYNELVSR